MQQAWFLLRLFLYNAHFDDKLKANSSVNLNLAKERDCMKFTFATLITVLVVFAFWGVLIYGLIKLTQNKQRSSANTREKANNSNTTWKIIANIILGVGIILTLFGALYIAIVQQGYAISACFVLASAFMGSLLASSTKKT